MQLHSNAIRVLRIDQPFPLCRLCLAKYVHEYLDETMQTLKFFVLGGFRGCRTQWNHQFHPIPVSMRAAQSPLASTQFFVLCVFCVQWASYLSIVDGALNPVSLCDLDQPMLKEVMAEN